MTQGIVWPVLHKLLWSALYFQVKCNVMHHAQPSESRAPQGHAAMDTYVSVKVMDVPGAIALSKIEII